MKIDWRNVSHIAAAVVGQIVPGVQMAEEAAWNLGSHDGRDKQQSVVDLVKAALTASEGITSKDLANDKDVEAATRKVIDAVVALHAVIAHKAAGVSV